jgi:hypothetical protein
MTTAEWDERMEIACDVRQQADKLLSIAKGIESQAEREAGVGCVNREPGFNCWVIDGLVNFFPDPRSAIEAKENQSAKMVCISCLNRIGENHKPDCDWEGKVTESHV